MASWGGFSEADLHRLKKDHLKSGEVESTEQRIRKANLNSVNKRQRPREKIKPKVSAPTKSLNSKQETIVAKSETDNSEANSKPECERGLKAETDTTQQDNSVITQNGSSNEEERVPDFIVEPERIQAIELTTLQKMQEKQKEMEDQNKKKKAALQETIRTRFRRTQAEANTLKAVHKELAHLDNLLSADVAVLRDTIEDATRDYHYALKRYQLAEAEFVSAKMDLHKKTERKEMLTEHLLTIIQQNEERKAKKLEELMTKLELSEEKIEEEVSKQQTIHPTENSKHRTEENEDIIEGTKPEIGDREISSVNIEKDEDVKVVESANEVELNKGVLGGNLEIQEEKEPNNEKEKDSGTIVV